MHASQKAKKLVSPSPTHLEQEWVTRSEFSRRLGVSREAVLKYVYKGLPTRADKRIPWPAGDEWCRRYVIPQRSGSWSARQRALAAAEVPFAAAAAYEGIRARFVIVPELLLSADRATPPWLIMAIIEILDNLIGLFALDVDEDLVDWQQSQLPEPDYAALFKRHGIRATKRQLQAWTAEKDTFIERVDDAIWHCGPDAQGSLTDRLLAELANNGERRQK
jgi:hypothetical protein